MFTTERPASREPLDEIHCLCIYCISYEPPNPYETTHMDFTKEVYRVSKALQGDSGTHRTPMDLEHFLTLCQRLQILFGSHTRLTEKCPDWEQSLVEAMHSCINNFTTKYECAVLHEWIMQSAQPGNESVAVPQAYQVLEELMTVAAEQAAHFSNEHLRDEVYATLVPFFGHIPSSYPAQSLVEQMAFLTNLGTPLKVEDSEVSLWAAMPLEDSACTQNEFFNQDAVVDLQPTAFDDDKGLVFIAEDGFSMQSPMKVSAVVTPENTMQRASDDYFGYPEMQSANRNHDYWVNVPPSSPQNQDTHQDPNQDVVDVPSNDRMTSTTHEHDHNNVQITWTKPLRTLKQTKPRTVSCSNPNKENFKLGA